MGTRLERDSLGEVEVDEARYWGAQTQRSLQHFAIGGERMPLELIHAYALVKQAAAEVNAELGELDPAHARWIARAAQEVAEGRLDDEFPLRVWQTGSGTHTNMNLNEVIAHRANELAGGQRGDDHPVHPIDHVNRGQSTNDTFPTAMHLCSALALRDRLAPAFAGLLDTLDAKARAFADVVKIGRTHLQDATPLTLGQEIGGWAAQLRRGLAAVQAAEPAVRELAAGGTAVGTGMNTHPDFAEAIAARLSAKTGLALTSAPNKFAALAGHEALATLSGALGTLAGALLKVANDVRWLASGPRCGLNEIRIPANEPGSSIMPGKVNPSQAEAVVMVALQVMGNHTTLSVAASQGSFELNVCKPVIAYGLLQSIGLLADVAQTFDLHCLRGLEPNPEVLHTNVQRSLMLVTALSPHLGYEAAARIAKKAYEEDLPLRDAALALGVTPDDFDRWVRPERMIGPGVAREP